MDRVTVYTGSQATGPSPWLALDRPGRATVTVPLGPAWARLVAEALVGDGWRGDELPLPDLAPDGQPVWSACRLA